QPLGLESRHVDCRRTLRAAGLAGQAGAQNLLELVVGKRRRRDGAGDDRLQEVGARPRRVPLLTRGGRRRTHRADLFSAQAGAETALDGEFETALASIREPRAPPEASALGGFA